MRRLSLFATTIFVLGASAPIFGQAAALPAGVMRVASVEGGAEYRLENGFRALLFPDPSKPNITVNIVYHVGSRHEDYGETGMAHLIEHLMSYGSTRHPDAKREQSDRGAQRNASTWFDRTNYYETFPATDANLEWAFDLEADRMLNALVRKDILDSQMSVVRNELEIGENNPLQVLRERIFSTAFLWHNYGKSTIGATSDLERVPIERLQAFYRRYYRPDNALLIVAGRFGEDRALRLLVDKFGALRNPADPLPKTYTEEPVQDGERVVTLRRVGDIQHVAVGYHTPAAAHPDSSLLDLVAEMLTSGPTGRLYKALVESRQAASVSGAVLSLREGGMLTINAAVRRDMSLDTARDTMLAQIDRLQSEPFTSEELERARAVLLRNVELILADSTDLAMELTEAIGAGDWRLLFVARDRLKQATLDDVRRAAAAYLKPSNRTLGLFIPEDRPQRTEIPAAPDLVTLLRDYKGGPPPVMGEAFDPTPDRVEGRAVRRALPGGLQLVVVPKKTRGSTVTAVLQLDYGDERSLAGQAGAADAVRQMLMRGTLRRTRQQIQDDLARLRSSVNVTGTAGRTQIAVQTIAASLPEMLKLVAEVLREPAFPVAEFDTMRQAAMARVASQRTDPQTLAQIAVQRALHPLPAGDPRAARTVDEEAAQLNALTLDALKTFHARFYGWSRATLAVTGDVNADHLEALATASFGTWTSTAPHQPLTRPFHATTALTQTIETPDKANAVLAAGLVFAAGDAGEDYPALLLANYMLGGHSKSRLYERIRAQEGLSYSVASQLSAIPGEPLATWIFAALTNPLNIAKVEAAFRQEIDKAVSGGFDPAEVETAKQGFLSARQVQRSDDGVLAQRLTALAYSGRTMEFDGTLEQKIAALSPAAIAAAVKRHLDPARVVVFRAGDFSKTR